MTPAVRVAVMVFGLLADTLAATHDPFDQTRASRSRSALPVHERWKRKVPEIAGVYGTDVHRGPRVELASATPSSSSSLPAGVVVDVVALGPTASSVKVPEPDRAQTAIW